MGIGIKRLSSVHLSSSERVKLKYSARCSDTVNPPRRLKEGSVYFIFSTIWGTFIGGRCLKKGAFIGGFTVCEKFG